MKAFAQVILTLGLIALSVWAYSIHFGGAGWIAFAAVLAFLGMSVG